MNASVWLDKAQLCLSSARLLSASGDTASTCNRAYYAMFNAARAGLIAVGEERLSTAKTHAGVISAFGQYLVKTGLIDQSIAGLMGKEAHRRLVADYQGTDIADDEAAEAIADATLFVNEVAELIRRTS